MNLRPQLQELALAVQKALLGAVTPDLRCFQGRVDGSHIRLRAVFAMAPDEEEAENVDVIETEILADMHSEGLTVTAEVLVVAPPEPCPTGGWTTFYARKEPA